MDCVQIQALIRNGKASVGHYVNASRAGPPRSDGAPKHCGSDMQCGR